MDHLERQREQAFFAHTKNAWTALQSAHSSQEEIKVLETLLKNWCGLSEPQMNPGVFSLETTRRIQTILDQLEKQE